VRKSNLNIRVLPYTIFMAFILTAFELIKTALLEGSQVWLSVWLTVFFVTLVSFISLVVLKKAVDKYYSEINQVEVNAKLSAEAANEQLLATNEELQASSQELKAITEELEGQKEELSSIINSIPDGIFRTDTKGIITLVNQELVKQTGLSRKELPGQDIRITIMEEDRPQFMEEFDKVLGGVPVKELSARNCAGDHIMVDIYPINNARGKVLGTLGVTREFTRTANIIEALDESKRELGQKIADMEILHTVTIDREKRIIELKDQVAALKSELEKCKGNN
jgi:PAS domain S-box-containing protein